MWPCGESRSIGCSWTAECLEDLQGHYKPPSDKHAIMMRLKGKWPAHEVLLETALETGWESREQLYELQRRMQHLYDIGAFEF